MNYACVSPDNVDDLAHKYWPTNIFVNSAITIAGMVICGFGDLMNQWLKQFSQVAHCR
jgi:hypothetical protein